MKAEFVIQRNPLPRQLNPKLRYWSRGYGLTTDLNKARRFESRELAAKTMGHFKDEIVEILK